MRDRVGSASPVGRRRMRLVVGAIVVTAVLAEVLSHIAYSLTSGSGWEAAELTEFAPDGRVPRELPHPFLGNVLNPATNSDAHREFHGQPISPWGLLDAGDPVANDPDEFRVCILGGSLAYWTSVQGWEDLRAEVAAAASARDKQVVAVRAALGGYKQPQQLAALAFLLANGAKFDLVINIDGFNEVVLPVLDLAPRGISLSFPRSWPDLIGQTGGPERAVAIGRIELAKERLRSIRGVREKSACRWSGVCKLAVGSLAARQARVLASSRAALTEPTEGDLLSLAARGPLAPASGATPEEIIEAAVDIWRHSSVATAALATAHGAAYLHVLQPNQYLDGRKPMSTGEANLARSLDDRFGRVVRAGYDGFLARPPAFPQARARFVDLTSIFVRTPDERYRDACCHLTPQGSRELASRIGTEARLLLDQTR